jgi:hypothetical protein
MVKKKFTSEDDALLAELGVEVEVQKTSSHSAREERIIAGFEDIERFFEKHGRLPLNDEDKDIFERIYAVRLDKIRISEECCAIINKTDKYDLLVKTSATHEFEDLDDETLLAELGVQDMSKNNITTLTHVKTRAEIRAAKEVARHITCIEFDKFKPMFRELQEDLKSGIRKTLEFKDNAHIKKGDFFILNGQKVYIAESGEKFVNKYDRPDSRLRVIYDNGTECGILLRSLQRALNKDERGRRITGNDLGPLFSDLSEENDIESGTIYVLRSLSSHPLVKENRDIIHKIGVTGGDIKKRIAGAELDPTFLMAEVEVVATYELSNINRAKLERLIHRFFESAKLNIEIKDRFGNPVTPREWFLVPLFIIDEAIKKIRSGEIIKYSYSPKNGRINII